MSKHDEEFFKQFERALEGKVKAAPPGVEITAREHFAGLAMKGILANWELLRRFEKKRSLPKLVAQSACAYAAALIECLREEHSE